MKNIKKRILSSIIIGSIILLPGLKGKAELKGLDGKSKTTKQTYLYNGDYFSSDIINNLEINSNIINILEGNNYNLINYNNQLGFIEKNTTDNNGFYNERKYTEIYQLGVTTAEVNLRVAPDIEENKILTIKDGEMLEILLISDNGWYLVNYNNQLGFIYSKYAKVIDFNKLENEVNNLPKTYNGVVALTDVNIRSEASTESQILGVLSKNQKLLMTRKLDNGWIEVTNKTNVGYVKSDYVKEILVVDGLYYKQVYMKKNAYLYNYPYAKVILELPMYETAFVYGETDDYYFIESEGNVGFIRKIDTKELNNRYVVVDISSQNAILYYNLDILLKSDVVTGKDSTPTDLGIYSIYNMELNRILIGDDYQTPVKYWMAFNKGEGLHDASWRKSFGGDIYHKKGSHGCVNLPTKVAKELYKQLSVGDKVLIKK